MRKIIIISGAVILVAIVAFLGFKYFPLKPDAPVIQTFSTKQNPAFKAVPLRSPLVVEVKNQEGFFNSLKGDNPVFAGMKGIQEFDQLFSSVNRFRDFCGSRSGISGLLKGKSIIVSVNPTGKNQLTNLYLVQLNSDEAGSATQLVSRELGSVYSMNRKNYDNFVIFIAKSAEINFFFACANDIFMFSEDLVLIEDAIRHSNSQNLLNDREFTGAYKLIDENALANIFINHKTIHQVVGRMVTPEVRKTISEIAPFSNWTGLDLSVKSSDLVLNGYSFTKDSSDNYLNIFHDQEAREMTIDKAIPANASFFVALSLKNTSTFLDKFETYIKANGSFYPREMSLIEFKKKTNTDPARLIKEVGGT